MYYLPILSAIALGASTILERVILRSKKIDVKTFQKWAFFGVSVLMIPLLFFFWKFNTDFFNLKDILIFTGMILLSFFANIFLFLSIKRERVSDIEPAIMTEPLFTVILAIAFAIISPELFSSDSKVIIPALIAGASLFIAHIKRNHIYFNKYFLFAILASFLFASELILTRFILEDFSPITLYFVRGLFLFLLTAMFSKKESITTKQKAMIFSISALWIIYRLIVYYGYLNLGVIFTTLLVMLGPVFTYAFAKVFLKEKIGIKNIIVSIIIISCILSATLN